MSENFENTVIYNDVVLATSKEKYMLLRWIKIEIEKHGDISQVIVYYAPEYNVNFTTKNLLVKVK